jgi:hypothetical protein
MAGIDEILQVVQDLAEYYEREPNDIQVNLWLDLLAEFDGAVLRAARLEHIRASAWFPKIAEMVKICTRLQAEVDQREGRVGMWLAAMDLYSLYWRGQISESELESNQIYRWFQKNCEIAQVGRADPRLKPGVTEAEIDEALAEELPEVITSDFTPKYWTLIEQD